MTPPLAHVSHACPAGFVGPQPAASDTARYEVPTSDCLRVCVVLQRVWRSAAGQEWCADWSGNKSAVLSVAKTSEEIQAGSRTFSLIFVRLRRSPIHPHEMSCRRPAVSSLISACICCVARAFNLVVDLRVTPTTCITCRALQQYAPHAFSAIQVLQRLMDLKPYINKRTFSISTRHTSTVFFRDT